ncbi:MAG: OprO/OprP family phosphate-selective porin [Aquificota bacterium]|nr:MAG: OprO/OprP family phosphate-selective porin [Aquificota bacterium]
MRKSLLAVAALMGAAILPAEAAVIKVDENTFANTGLKLQIWAQRLGKTTPGGKDYTDFSINNARIYFSGQVNKFVQFGANLDFAIGNNAQGRTNHSGTASTRVNDAFINLKLMDEFQVMAGLYRLPFSRAALTDSYSYYIPTGYGYSVRGNMFTPFTIGSAVQNGYRDAGLTFWGNIMDGLIKYQIGVFDGRWDHVSGALGTKDNLAFAGRIQFTPTMLGFKGEKGFTLADTYLGKQNVLSIGLGYNTQKWDNGAGDSATGKAWTVDAMWEQKFGDIVPNLQLGYQDRKDMPAGTISPIAKAKDRAYYVQGQLLYDQVVGVGKPALAIRYEKQDDRTASNLDTNRVGVFLNYYIKGQDAKIQFGADVVSLKNKNVDNRKNYTDWTLALQTQF